VALELPCLLKTPRFLQYISDPKTYRDAFDLIVNQNTGQEAEGCKADGQKWSVLPYRSRFLGTPDKANSYGRFFVLVPGADYDRWIQFGIWPPEDRARYAEQISNVSIVAVSKAKDPKAENRFDALVDWWRVVDQASGQLFLKYKIDVPPDGEPASTPGVTGNCQECHKTIPIGIHPEAVYEFKGRTLRKARGSDRMKIPNQLRAFVFENYRRRPVYEIGADDSFALPENFGPVFGPDSEWTGTERTPDSLRACIAPHRLSANSLKRVIENMNCAACHSGRSGKNEGRKVFGSLNFPRATETRRVPEPDLRRDLIRSHIDNRVMPLDYVSGEAVRLSRSERSALYDCLSQEYFQPNNGSGLFVDWLQMKIDSTGRPTTTGVAGAASVVKASGKATAPKWAMSGDTSASGYDERCLKCHPKVAGVNGDGPSLFGISSRQAASVQSFGYSADMSEAGTKGLTWDEANLMDYLKDPDQFLTDRLGRPAQSDMLKRYPDEAVRRAIVKYLMTLK
jgi:cytochrome c2